MTARGLDGLSAADLEDAVGFVAETVPAPVARQMAATPAAPAPIRPHWRASPPPARSRPPSAGDRRRHRPCRPERAARPADRSPATQTEDSRPAQEKEEAEDVAEEPRRSGRAAHRRLRPRQPMEASGPAPATPRTGTTKERSPDGEQPEATRSRRRPAGSGVRPDRSEARRGEPLRCPRIRRRGAAAVGRAARGARRGRVRGDDLTEIALPPRQRARDPLSSSLRSGRIPDLNAKGPT